MAVLLSWEAAGRTGGQGNALKPGAFPNATRNLRIIITNRPRAGEVSGLAPLVLANATALP